MSIDKYNSEGYYDPTAYEALSAIEKEERALRAFRPIIYICSPFSGRRGRKHESRTALQPICRGKGLHPHSAAFAVSTVSERQHFLRNVSLGFSSATPS